jgi:cullin 3
MKSRKALHFNDIIAEVTKHLASSFVSEPRMIKQQIESLIEREYLKRDDDDARVF